MNKFENTRTKDLLREAILAFQRETGLRFKQRALRPVFGEKKPDATIDLVTDEGATKFFVETKQNIAEATIGRLSHDLRNQRDKWLLVTTYVPTHLANKMKDLQIQFIDTVGNAFINRYPLFIMIYGNRRSQTLERAGEREAFGRAGLHVIFALLCEDELVNATYREIGEAANVALGTVAMVVKDLMMRGFILELRAGGRRLLRKKDLLDKWTVLYAERLRQKTLIGRYTADHLTFWRTVNLRRFDAVWGAEVAASKLTQQLRPEIITIYTRKPVNDLVVGLRLRRDDHGTIELRDRFWRFEMGGFDRTVAPALLVYADLLATGDKRNIDAAKLIYDEHLERNFKET